MVGGDELALMCRHHPGAGLAIARGGQRGAVLFAPPLHEGRNHLALTAHCAHDGSRVGREVDDASLRGNGVVAESLF
ncbi:Uncharacterised protein [Mycobacteroides abscessus subsp. abscessus]|nr:Uncharacterised protein [Mycobacteroides abscessus subsp. abscessus]